MAVKMYDDEVRAFVHDSMGRFVIFSHDQHLNKNIRWTIQRHLCIREECIFNVFSRDKFEKMLRQVTGGGHKVIVFLEREENGVFGYDLVKMIKDSFSDAQSIVLTKQVPREILVYLHDIGAGNIITKPTSPDLLIQKISMTARHFGQIGSLISTGHMLNQNGEFEKSALIAEKILELKPDHPAALLLLGDSHKGRGNADDALGKYRQASKAEGLFLDPLKKIAELHRQIGNLGEETVYLEKLDKLSPLNVERKIRIGDNYVALGEKDKALEKYDAALKTAAKDVSVSGGGLARTIADHCMQAAPDISEKYLRLSLDAKRNVFDMSDMEVINRLGISLRKQGKWGQAVQEYAKALKISPHDVGLHYNMALAYTEGGRFQEAAVHLDKALRLNPDFWNSDESVCLNVATVFFHAGRKESAAGFLAKLLDWNPESVRAREMLSQLSRIPAVQSAVPEMPPPAPRMEVFNI